MTRTYQHELETEGFCDILDITGLIRDAVSDSGLREGIVTAFVPGATAGVTTVEYESGLIHDLKQFFERIIPQDGEYLHNERWKDGNGFSHVRAALLGPGLQVPVFECRPVLGTWQQVILVDFDNHPRRRRLVVQAMGDR